MSKDIFGTAREQVISQISYTDKIDFTSVENAPSGTINYTFTGDLSEAISDAPDLGTKSEHLDSSLILTKRTFKTENGGITSVALEYNKTSTDESDESDESTTYSLSSTENTASIVLHSAFSGVASAVKTVAQALIDGIKPWDIVTATIENGTLVIKTASETDGNAVAFQNLIDKAKKT